MKLTMPRFPVLLASFLTVAVLVALIALSGMMYPIRRGNSADFWHSACMVDIAGIPHSMGGAAFVRDGRCYYAPMGMHGPLAHWLPEGEAMRDYPAVLAKLDALAAAPEADDFRPVAYRRWLSLPRNNPRDVNALITEMNDAAIDRWFHRFDSRLPGLSAFLYDEDRELRAEVDKSRYYWANFVFEFLFFTGIIWFFLWPAIRRTPPWRWLVHWALAPFLFLTPLWLGYAIMSRMSWGPSGGILYPWCVQLLQGVRFDSQPSWEVHFLKSIPPLLGTLSQGYWFAEVFEMRGAYFTGPIHAALGSAILCTLVVAGKFLSVYAEYSRRKHAPRGFEVITDDIGRSTKAER